MLGTFGALFPAIILTDQLRQTEMMAIFAQIVPILLILVISVSLWIFAEQIAFYMTAEMKPVEKLIPVDTHTLLGLAVTVGGMMILLDALAQFKGYSVYLLFVQQSTQMPPEQQIRWTTDLIFFILKMAVGLFMLIKPYSIVDYLERKHRTPFIPISGSQDE